MALNIFAAFFVCVTQSTKESLIDYFSRHQCEIESRQLGDLEEAHRRRILSLKSWHQSELHHLQGLLHTQNARYMRLEGEYDFVTTAYQEQMRACQEQEDRIDYLQRKLTETGLTSPSTRQPYSAPSSQIQFAKPPKRARGGVAAGLPSPLSQVCCATFTNAVIHLTNRMQVTEAGEIEE